MGNSLMETFDQVNQKTESKSKQYYEQPSNFSKHTIKKSPVTARNHKAEEPFIINIHRTKEPFQLAQIFSIFLNEPFQYFRSIEIVKEINQCCDQNVVRTQLYNYRRITLDNLLVIKRMKHLKFAESQIWYLLKAAVDLFAYMSSKGLPYGSINPHRFFLREGKFFKIDVSHFLESNEHCCELTAKNYYSPEYIKCFTEDKKKYCGQQKRKFFDKIDIFRSEIFSFGLLVLEVASCPEPHPKFHKYNFQEFLWNQVYKRFESIQKYYSEKLVWILSLMLREQSSLRPDWNYLSIWLRKEFQGGRIDIAPCIFWSI